MVLDQKIDSQQLEKRLEPLWELLTVDRATEIKQATEGEIDLSKGLNQAQLKRRLIGITSDATVQNNVEKADDKKRIEFCKEHDPEGLIWKWNGESGKKKRYLVDD